MTPQNPVCLSGKLQGDALTCILGVMQVSLGTKRDFPHVAALAGWHAAVGVLMTIILAAGSAGKAGAAPEAAPLTGFRADFAERDITPAIGMESPRQLREELPPHLSRPVQSSRRRVRRRPATR